MREWAGKPVSGPTPSVAVTASRLSVTAKRAEVGLSNKDGGVTTLAVDTLLEALVQEFFQP